MKSTNILNSRIKDKYLKDLFKRFLSFRKMADELVNKELNKRGFYKKSHR